MRTPRTIEDVIALLGSAGGLRVNNHWIPASYLSAFTSNGKADGRLYLYSRDGRSAPVATGVPVSAVERRLYVLENVSTPLPDGIERFLARFIEEPFVPLRNRLGFGDAVGLYPSLTVQDRADLALWIAVQHGRTPRARDHHLWLDELGVTMRLLSRARTASEPDLNGVSRESLIAQVRTGGVKIRAPKERWLAKFLGVCQDASKVIRKLEFARVRLPVSEPPFPVPDCPVVITRRLEDELDYDYQTSWEDPLLEAILALTPRMALIVRGRQRPDSVFGTPQHRASIQERLVRNTDRFLYASRPTDGLTKLLALPRVPDMVVAFDEQRHRVGESVSRVAAAIEDAAPPALYIGRVPR